MPENHLIILSLDILCQTIRLLLPSLLATLIIILLWRLENRSLPALSNMWNSQQPGGVYPSCIIHELCISILKGTAHSISLISSIQNKQSLLYPLLTDIQICISKYTFFQAHHTYRDANQLADFIAKYAQNGKCHWMDQHLIPKDMFFILQADRKRAQTVLTVFGCRVSNWPLSSGVVFCIKCERPSISQEENSYSHTKRWPLFFTYSSSNCFSPQHRKLRCLVSSMKYYADLDEKFCGCFSSIFVAYLDICTDICRLFQLQ